MDDWGVHTWCKFISLCTLLRCFFVWLVVLLFPLLRIAFIMSKLHKIELRNSQHAPSFARPCVCVCAWLGNAFLFHFFLLPRCLLCWNCQSHCKILQEHRHLESSSMWPGLNAPWIVHTRRSWKLPLRQPAHGATFALGPRCDGFVWRHQLNLVKSQIWN